MTLAELSIKRPAFITSIVLAMLAVGYVSMSRLGVDLFPNITFPVVTVTTIYPGAGPKEMELLVSKVLEEELSSVPGIKTLRSVNKEGISTVIAEFTLETDVKYAEQQIRDRSGGAKGKLPTEVKDPIIRRIDPADQPILMVGLQSNLSPAKLYDIANDEIKPFLEQINQVGLVSITGARKREIHVLLDAEKLKKREISASTVANRLAASGVNVPIGKIAQGEKDMVFRSLGEYSDLDSVRRTIVNFLGNDVPTTIDEIGTVEDSLVDETSRTFVNGEKGLLINVFRQSGANTIKVADTVIKKVSVINDRLKAKYPDLTLSVVRDSSKMIRANVDDVKESIFLGIILTILVVFLFLGNIRSTLITGLALPNSLLGAFILMYWAGFTINVMSLLALSLSVGLLVDDAIVVRENVFRHMEMGKKATIAALVGTKEVTLAVVATTLCVIAVFGPIGFLQGIVGQFFKEFGLTICFAMMISLFDALTVAPMMSAYFAGDMHAKPNVFMRYTLQPVIDLFAWIQDRIEDVYVVVLKFSLRMPLVIIAFAIACFAGSIYLTKYVPKTFLSAQDFGEFMVSLELPQGTNLAKMSKVSEEVNAMLRAEKEVETTVLTVGSGEGQGNIASFFISLVSRNKRTMNTTQYKDHVRDLLKPYAYATPVVKDVDMVAGGQRPFNVILLGDDLQKLETASLKLFEKLKKHPGLSDPEISHKPGKPEVQIVLDRQRAEKMGVSTSVAGYEMRTLMEGQTPAVLREPNGNEYDIRVRLRDDQRDLAKRFHEAYIPNINFALVKLDDVAKLVETEGPAVINRQDRGRFISVAGDITPKGPGMAAVMTDIDKMLKPGGEIELPEGIRHAYIGQAENFKELMSNMLMAVILSILFTYLVLASLYESFVTPFTIMLVLPLAAAGAFVALFLTGKSLDLNSMIGCIMLFGIASKNSILLVDYANGKVREGYTRAEAMMEAGKTRLRPILMTTLALIAGMLPIAIGLNEASKQRTSMGVAIIGGLISSTVLSLIVVPAAYDYIDRFRVWSNRTAKRIFSPQLLKEEKELGQV